MLINNLKAIYHGFRSFVYKVGNVPRAIKKADDKSYYPEIESKSKFEKIMDNMRWLFKYGEVNEFYTLYGMDTKEMGMNCDLYQDYISFMTIRNKKNNVFSSGDISHAILLRDKFIFYKLMSSSGLPVPKVFAIIKNGKLFDVNRNEMAVGTLIDKENYFVKEINGECASYVKKIHKYSDFLTCMEEIVKQDEKSYILQEALIQSQEMNQINPCAINTLRIVTVNNGKKPYIFSAVLRVGTKLTGNVDNWAAGGGWQLELQMVH